MRECDLCGGPRCNGAAVRPHPSRDHWVTCDPNADGARHCCRACASDAVGDNWAAIGKRRIENFRQTRQEAEAEP